MNQVGQELPGANASIQPTLTIRPGTPMRMMVNEDLVLRPYRPLTLSEVHHDEYIHPETTARTTAEDVRPLSAATAAEPSSGWTRSFE